MVPAPSLKAAQCHLLQTAAEDFFISVPSLHWELLISAPVGSLGLLLSWPLSPFSTLGYPQCLKQ